ncbi:MAG: DNA repair protein RecO [Alphaproteobacteria bacterium]|nr:DNA repair protein RecO [Alphaproteobacteria bacterium]
MEWSDEGIVLSVRPHGETSAIAEVFTRGHGRYLGLVRGGRSRRMRPVLQIGNHVEASWKARLSEHLGAMSLELQRGYAAVAMNSSSRLCGLNSMCSLLRMLPERDAHANLFEVTLFVLSFFDDDSVWPALMVRWEMAFLEEMGFGLDLKECAATGGNDNLAFVSPKSGRAVSFAAGEPYADRLFRLPNFMVEGRNAAMQQKDLVDGLAITAHFLEKHLLQPKGDDLPEARVRLIAELGKTGH